MLQINHLHHHYFGHLECLHDIDVTFDKGVTVLLGGEGDGKTTLLKCIAGLCEPEEGNITLDGAPLRYAKEGDVGMVFDDLALLERRTLYYNLTYPLRLRRMPKADWDAIIQPYLAKWQIEPFALGATAFRAPQELRIKVALCRAQLTHRRVMLVDNPLHGLAPPQRDKLFALLCCHLPSMGEVVLYATDSAAEARSLQAPAVLLSQGYMVMKGEVDALAADPPCVYAGEMLVPLYQVFGGVADEGKVRFDGFCLSCRYPRAYEGKPVTVGVPPNALSFVQEEGGAPIECSLYQEGVRYAQCLGVWAPCTLPVGTPVRIEWGSIHLFDQAAQLRLASQKEENL